MFLNRHIVFINVFTTIQIILLIFANSFNTFAQNDLYKLKAGFIEKFVRYIEWPNQLSMHDKDSPFIIGIMGENPFDGELVRMYQTDKGKILGKEVQLKFYSTPEEIDDCHVLFIAESAYGYIQKIIDRVRSRPILTISDHPGLTSDGVHISFYLRQDNRLHFEINDEVAKNSIITFDIRLLEVAKIVRN